MRQHLYALLALSVLVGFCGLALVTSAGAVSALIVLALMTGLGLMQRAQD
ncbi:MAG: hypothetical protein HOP13_16515 [Alphaproteobacteria bacterium]|nr:hypothetical protein [Alphaproteobacteria bacterium]